jgi:hypothetical protein
MYMDVEDHWPQSKVFQSSLHKFYAIEQPLHGYFIVIYTLTLLSHTNWDYDATYRE